MIDTFNKFLVGVQGDQIVVLRPGYQCRMAKDDALILAAWLVALADPGDEDFHDVLAAVMST